MIEKAPAQQLPIIERKKTKQKWITEDLKGKMRQKKKIEKKRKHCIRKSEKNVMKA